MLSSLTRHYIFAALILLCPVWSIAATPPPYLVVINDGTAERPGMDYVDAAHPWGHLVAANAKFPGIHLKHPFGMWVFDPTDPDSSKMVFDQWSRMQAYAAANPDDKNAQAKADTAAFIEAWSNRPAKQFLSIYVGGSWSLRALPDETPKQWAERAYKELGWARAACPDVIAFDNEGGTNDLSGHPHFKVVEGPQGGMIRLIRMLQADGITVAIEAAPHIGITRYHDLWNIYSDVMGGKVAHAGGWDKYRAGRPNALRDPHKAPRCFYELGGRGLTLEQKAAEFKKSQERGEIPLVFLSDVNKGLLEIAK